MTDDPFDDRTSDLPPADAPAADRPPAAALPVPDQPPAADRPPAAVSHLVRQRAEARAARDFATADAIKAQIEAAGWRVVDRRGGSTIERAAPPDRVASDGSTVHGSWQSVPSVLAEPPAFRASVILAAGDPVRVAGLASLIAGSPLRPQVVTVVTRTDGGSESHPTASAHATSVGDIREPPEQLVMAAGLTPAALINAGIRRARGEIIVLGDAGGAAEGEALPALLDALRDPTVACAGLDGLGSSDLRQFAPSGGPVVAALAGSWIAFRRSDYLALGPLEERFHGVAGLTTWWSLVLRDGTLTAQPEPGAAAPRAAIRVALPVSPDTGHARGADPERDRADRRDRYRIIDAFGGRLDLAVAPTPVGPR